jgi:hypothetical protein
MFRSFYRSCDNRTGWSIADVMQMMHRYGNDTELVLNAILDGETVPSSHVSLNTADIQISLRFVDV